MAWLKYTPVFKHGYGQVGYKEIQDMEYLDEIKDYIREEFGDPDRMREPVWEVTDYPHLDFLVKETKEIKERIEMWQRKLDNYSSMLQWGQYEH
jgi:hypothetical protein